MTKELKAFFDELLLQLAYAGLAFIAVVMIVLDLYAIANLFWGITYAIR